MAPFRLAEKVREKANQAAEQDNWLLIIKGSEHLVELGQVTDMVEEVSEWIYDHPNLIGVVLFSQWQFPAFKELNVELDEISVATSEYRQGQFQQTVILPNRFAKFGQRQGLLGAIRQFALKSGWEPVFSRQGPFGC